MASSPAPSGMSPAPTNFAMPQQGPGNEPSMARLMQIKVLYTFDDEKTNCLARCSQPVLVHTLQLEDNTEIGIVELRTCIRAILSASPELVAPKASQDYTIYAYDYSEYETPLVGQGMLSWALASTSATPTAPAEQSLTPVTGRVTRNVRSLFPNAGPPEILQVKLKLVPVPKAMESEYAEGMERYRDPNNFASQGFDPAAWNAFLQTRPPQTNSATSPGSIHNGPLMPSPVDYNPTTFFAPAPQPNLPNQPPQFVFQANNGSTSANPGGPGSRPGTPRTRRASTQQSRPSSRASTRGVSKAQRPVALQRVDSAPAAVPTSEPNDLDNAQARKRARIQQTDWRGPSAFENHNEPLRVAASAGAAMRGHRPSFPGHPSAADIAAAEPGPRPPTPRPNGPRLPRNQSSTSSDQSAAPRSRWYQSPYAMSADGNECPGSEATSPQYDGMSTGSTPADIPSSPPVIHRASIEPSSPQLPRLTNHQDSGFVSGTLDEDLNEDRDGHLQMAKVTDARPGLTSEISFLGEPSMEILPQSGGVTQATRQALAPKPSSRNRRAGSVAGSSPRLPPMLHSRHEAISPAPILDTEIVHHSEAPQQPHGLRARFSESVEPGPAGSRAGGKAGSGAKRYKAIQNRLEEDVAAGKIPPFCKNCGEIDTPTWRKCYVRTVKGTVDPGNLAESAGVGFVTWEALDDAEGPAYRIIKKSVAKEDEGYEQLQLCNSCGIWLFKNKRMRTAEQWQKAPSKNPPRKKSRAKSDSVPAEIKTDAVGMDVDDAALWSALTTEGMQGDNNEWALTDVSGRSDNSMPKSTGKRKRVLSTGDIHGSNVAHDSNDGFLADKLAMAAYQRAVQSSPPKFPGSKCSPIDLSKDESPRQGVRRLLFPSPRKPGEEKTLDGSPNTKTSTKSTGAGVLQMQDPFADTSIDQENASQPSSRTPKGRKSRLAVLKTPTRSSPRLAERNQARQATGSPQKPSHLATPSRAASQHFMGAELTPFTAQLNQTMSDGIGGFGSFSEQDPSGMFAFSDFSNMDDFGLDALQLPQSDADFFPVFDDVDDMAEIWNGGPLLEGELDALLQEAGDDGFMDLDTQNDAGTTGQPTPAGTEPGVDLDGVDPLDGDGTTGHPTPAGIDLDANQAAAIDPNL